MREMNTSEMENIKTHILLHKVGGRTNKKEKKENGKQEKDKLEKQQIRTTNNNKHKNRVLIICVRKKRTNINIIIYVANGVHSTYICDNNMHGKRKRQWPN